MRRLVAIALLVLAGCGGGGGSTPPPTVVATPVISPAAGTYAAVQSVTITCATAGAAIHYTTDGSSPTAASPTYAGAIAVTTTTTVKAMATLAGQTDSAVATAAYVLKAATPVIAPAAGTYATAQAVTITSATPGAAIHFTVDGAAPTSASPTYADPIPLPLGGAAVTTTVKAVALAAGFQDSAVASSTFTIDPAATPAAAPTFSVPAGTYDAVQAVAITTTTAGASVYYTKDGSTPTTGSTLYSAPVTVDASLTLKAIAAGGGHTPSPVASATYVITLPTVATPTFSPGQGSYASPQTVTIATATAGAAIYYTADGTTPTTASTLYGAPVLVDATRTLKAIATRTGFLPSAVGSAAYVISGGGTPFVTLCNGLFDKVTSLFTTCLKANPAIVTQLLGSGAGFCLDRQKEIDAGKIQYDATQGAACNAAIQTLDCSGLSAQGGFTVPPACQASLSGQVGNGLQCYDSADCASGFCGWDLASGTCPDTCRPFIQAGGACDGAGCASGLVCDGPFGAQTCKAPSGAGGACPCQDNLWCDTSGATPVCRAFLSQNAPCDPQNSLCNVLTTCVGTTPTCQPWIGVDAACDPAADRCGIGYTCSGVSNKCVSVPGLGEPCTTLCVGSWCDFLSPTPTCKALLADGATCNPVLQGFDCASGSCTASSRCETLSCHIP